MKKLSKILIFLVLGAFLLVGSAWAYPILQIDDPSTSGVDVTIEDTDKDGVVIYSGPVGSWLLSVSTGLTKPSIGDTDFPKLDLNSIDLSGGAGTLIISLTDRDFTLPDTIPGFFSEIGGTTDGTVELRTYLDESNTMFGTGTELSNFSFSSSPFSGSKSTFINPSDPFSITIVATITHGSAGQITSFDAGISPVPEPATMLLFGVGLCGLAFVGRKKVLKHGS